MDALRQWVKNGEWALLVEADPARPSAVHCHRGRAVAGDARGAVRRSTGVVSERLEQVQHRGLGEMQVLAAGVGDLKKVLTNVKTRGTSGEVQLGTLLEQVLAPAQYEANVATKTGSADRVEFAIKLPGRGPSDAGGGRRSTRSSRRKTTNGCSRHLTGGDADAVEARLQGPRGVHRGHGGDRQQPRRRHDRQFVFFFFG